MQCEVQTIYSTSPSFFHAFSHAHTCSSTHLLAHSVFPCHSPDAIIPLSYSHLYVCLFSNSFISEICKACVHCLISQPGALCVYTKGCLWQGDTPRCSLSARSWVLLCAAWTYDVNSCLSCVAEQHGLADTDCLSICLVLYKFIAVLHFLAC